MTAGQGQTLAHPQDIGRLLVVGGGEGVEIQLEMPGQDRQGIALLHHIAGGTARQAQRRSRHQLIGRLQIIGLDQLAHRQAVAPGDGIDCVAGIDRNGHRPLNLQRSIPGMPHRNLRVPTRLASGQQPETGPQSN